MAETPQQPNPQTPKEPAVEKLEFLKREEVRTLAKDIAKVREAQAQNERERITALKRDEKQQPKPEASKPKAPLAQQAPPARPEQKPPLPLPKQEIERQPPKPKRPLSRFEKLFIRLVIVAIVLFVIFNIFAFSFWYFFIS